MRRAVLIGTLAVAALDMLDCAVFYGLFRGVTLTQCFQGVASGLLGPAAFRGGWSTVLLGGLLHVFNAGAIVSVFVLASRRLPLLARRPIVSGVLYGWVAFVVMTFVVVPLSAAHTMQITLPNILNGFIEHALFVGLPSALAARAAAAAATTTAVPLPSSPNPPHLPAA